MISLGELVSRLSDLGVQMQAVNGKLSLEGNGKPLSEELRQAVKQHCSALLELATQNTQNTQYSDDAQERDEPAEFRYCLDMLTQAYQDGSIPDAYAYCQPNGELWETVSLHRRVGGLLREYEEAPDDPHNRKAVEVWTDYLLACQEVWEAKKRERQQATDTPKICIRCRTRPALGTSESPAWCHECVELDRQILRAAGLPTEIDLPPVSTCTFAWEEDEEVE